MDIIYYKDITNEFLKNAKPSVNFGVHFAKSITKDGITYRVNKRNRINIRNHEIENAYWFLSIMGGKIIILPEIASKEYIKMADYKYKPVKGKAYFIEEKEVFGNDNSIIVGRNCIYHKIKDSKNQSDVILLDISNVILSKLNLHYYLNYTFKFLNYSVIVIIKKNNRLIGIYTNKKERHPLTKQWGRSINK